MKLIISINSFPVFFFCANLSFFLYSSINLLHVYSYSCISIIFMNFFNCNKFTLFIFDIDFSVSRSFKISAQAFIRLCDTPAH